MTTEQETLSASLQTNTESDKNETMINLTAEGNAVKSQLSGNEYQFNRPGIQDEFLIKARNRHVNAEEALELCGLRKSGIWIPYSDINGNPVIINGRPYGRLRLDEPTDNCKYLQAPDSGSHAYVPFPFIQEFKQGIDLFITEGCFKCLSLVEAQYQAVALPGLFAYAHGELLPELKAALDFLKPSRVLFIGDSDTCLNYRFSIAAVKLAELIKPIPLLLPRMPLNGPKGIDDLKESLS